MPRTNDGALAPDLHVFLVMAICAVPGLSQTRRSVTVGRASMDVSLLDADTTNTIDVDRRGPLPLAKVEPDSGLTARDLVGRARGSNAEFAARRIDIDRARALLRQAGLRPNPRIEFEHGSGRIVDNPGERETSVGVSIPLEVRGQRGRRIDLAEAELAAAEAEYADRVRRLAADTSSAFVEALAAMRVVETYRRLSALDIETMRIVEAEIAEGESAPLELNLIRVETDRLRSQAALAVGRLLTAMLRLKMLVGARHDEALQLRQELVPLASRVSPDALPSREEAIATAYQIGVYRVTDLIGEQRRFADVERDYTAALAEPRQVHTDLQAAVGAPPVDTGRPAKDENDDR